MENFSVMIVFVALVTWGSNQNFWPWYYNSPRVNGGFPSGFNEYQCLMMKALKGDGSYSLAKSAIPSIFEEFSVNSPYYEFRVARLDKKGVVFLRFRKGDISTLEVCEYGWWSSMEICE